MENKIPYRVENIVRNGEITCYKQYLHSYISLVPQSGAFRGNGLTLYDKILSFNDPEEEGFGKYCGKRRKCS